MKGARGRIPAQLIQWSTTSAEGVASTLDIRSIEVQHEDALADFEFRVHLKDGC
jgi:hypothetical protein